MASSDPFRDVQVERVQPLGPSMQRVTFAPRDRAALPAERPHGGHCRLRFPGRDASAPPQPRAYTYRRWHADGRFDVDFVVHAGDGPAARWLRQVRPGACIGWRHGGPPKICLAAPNPEPTILIADLSGLPVMAALIEQAHPTRQVSLILTVCPDAAPDPPPQGRARIHHLPSPEDVEQHLLQHATLPGTRVFAACEATQMRRYRRLLLDVLALPRSQVITSGYWKTGLTTEDVDQAKRRADWFGDGPASRLGG
ncbi:Iron import ATP-binding/permease protein IrtA [Pseudooceanicola marinus]|uniref:Iron import ATP-binding/permease protein IrtA n=2 Tax=Pseudooceanicola marinus TaxID=396013 RepID=A0A1X6Y7J4_9RHOB|nr:siderophore-interacting protein [Pseudooceanicola marinus]SLN13080.1 Iron import ATP-binding/permease protein IrtA [Pseudooceanicola marinus]